MLNEQFVEPGLVVVDAAERAVQHTLVLRLHIRLRRRHVDPLEQGVDGGVANLLRLADPLGLQHLLAKACAQLVDGVELTGQLRKLVVGFGQLALLDRLDRDSDLGIAPGVISGRQLGGEYPRLVHRQSDHRIVETRDKPAGADLVGQPFGGGVRHVLAVDSRRQVDRDEIPVATGRSTPVSVPNRARNDSTRR